MRILIMTPELSKIHKTIIMLHRELFDESPSPMKLQKLCYYAQGYFLAKSNGQEALFTEEFQAWVHGPVIYELYQEYKSYGWRQIPTEFTSDELIKDTPEYEHLNEVVEAYGRFDGAALSTMTHRETPWLDARGDIPEIQGRGEPICSPSFISKTSLQQFFSQKLRAYG